MKLFVKKLHENAFLPEYAHELDAALDLRSTETVLLKVRERYTFSLGIAIKLPSSTVGIVEGRSGNASKKGLTTIGNVIDEGYEGEIHVILVNLGSEDVQVNIGDKIAQLLILPIYYVEVIEQSFNEESARGSSGLGSTS